MNGKAREQIALWVEKQLDETLSPEEFNQLQQVLIDDPDARELYLDLMHQNAHLQLESGCLSVASDASDTKLEVRSEDRSRPANRTLWRLVFGGLAAGLLLMLWRNFDSKDSQRGDSVIAEITDSSDAQWGDCTLPTAVGSSLQPGRLRIERGLVTIRFSSGAMLTLESPADLEIQSPLGGRLLAGTAVVEVPDSAHGFTLATPTAVTIDYGTAFAVTVDTKSQTSAIEVLDGEVEVKHAVSDVSLRLKEKQRVVASKNVLSESAVSIGESTLFKSQSAVSGQKRLLRITTADGRGGDASVCRSRDADVLKNSHSELVLIKNPHEGYERFSRKGYFSFDLNSLAGNVVTSAKFVLALTPSGLGFASKVNDCEFAVYGLVDESADGWSANQLTWQNAPANLDGAAEIDDRRARELGRFVVRRGVQHGQVFIEGKELVQFLNDDTNQNVTLIIVRETKELEPGGLVHGFANESNTEGAPPTLLVTIEAPQGEN